MVNMDMDMDMVEDSDVEEQCIDHRHLVRFLYSHEVKICKIGSELHGGSYYSTIAEIIDANYEADRYTFVTVKKRKGGHFYITSFLNGHYRTGATWHGAVYNLYFKNGKLHRRGGPAFITPHLTKWFRNGEYHRTDGPAIEFAYGAKIWYVNGIPHRIDGPAIDYGDGRSEWFINGRSVPLVTIF